MSRPPPQKPNSPKRIDTASPAPALTQSPFAALAQKVVAAAPASPVAVAASEPQPPREAKPQRLGRLLLRRETKHRGGKTVVVISGFAALRDHSDAKLGELEKHLKSRLGCGGTVELEAREILIQGDRPDEIATLLRTLGYEVAGVVSRPGKSR